MSTRLRFDWATRRSQFYDRLTLLKNGDPIEAYGSEVHNLETRLPEYVRFWRCHVCPATQRPKTWTAYNPNAADSVIKLSQRSHSVFAYVVEACENLRQVKQHGPGDRYEHWYNTVMYAGNALQMFASVQKVMRDYQTGARGPLAVDLQTDINIFTDWSTNWIHDYDTAIAFRNYVTHNGRFQIFIERTPFAPATYSVLKMSEVTRTNAEAISWYESVDDFQSKRHRFATVAEVGDDLVTKTITWLNRAYEHINLALEPLLGTYMYSEKWGTPLSDSEFYAVQPQKQRLNVPSLDGVGEPRHSPSTPVGSGSGTVIVPIQQTGSTASSTSHMAGPDWETNGTF